MGFVDGRRRKRAYQKGQQQLAFDAGGHWRWAEQGGASPGIPSLGTLALHSSLASPSLVFHSELAKYIQIGFSSILLGNRENFARQEKYFLPSVLLERPIKQPPAMSPVQRWGLREAFGPRKEQGQELVRPTSMEKHQPSLLH